MESPLLRTTASIDHDLVATTAEITGLCALARARGARSLVLGSGRTLGALASVAALTDEWEHHGGHIAGHVTWPETAASWLRQARRFSATPADLRVMTGPAPGWAQMTRRLLWSTHWTAATTLVLASVADPAALALVGTAHLNGLTGVDTDGATWTVIDDTKHPVAGAL